MSLQPKHFKKRWKTYIIVLFEKKKSCFSLTLIFCSTFSWFYLKCKKMLFFLSSILTTLSRWATESSAVRSCTPFNPQLDCYPATPTPSCYPSTPTPSCYPNTPNPLQFDASPPTSPESACLQPITLPSMPPSLPHARRGHDYHHFPARISPTLRAEPLTRSPETPPISPIGKKIIVFFVVLY